jgi:hypothetical protein
VEEAQEAPQESKEGFTTKESYEEAHPQGT